MHDVFFQSQRKLLSRWLNPYWHVAKNFADTAKTLATFFKQFPKRSKQSRAPAAAASADSSSAVGAGAAQGSTSSPPGTIEFERPTSSRQTRKTLSSELVRHGDVEEGSGSHRTLEQQRELLAQVWNNNCASASSGGKKASSFSANWQMQDELVDSPTTTGKAKAKRVVAGAKLKSSEAIEATATSSEVEGPHLAKRTRVEKPSEATESAETAELHSKAQAARREPMKFDGSAKAHPKNENEAAAASAAKVAAPQPQPQRRKSTARKKHPAGATLFDDVKAAIGKKGVARFKKQVLKLRSNKTGHDWKVAIDGFAGA